jgi:hypothetical protein
MPRPRQRVCLQEGLKLDLNRLIRREPGRSSCRKTRIGRPWASCGSSFFAEADEAPEVLRPMPFHPDEVRAKIKASQLCGGAG